MEKVTKAFTHGGKFHADDVFSYALLKTIYPDVTIERGNRVPEGFDGLVFDIGGGRFDHHQEGAKVRENGIPYAAFGLLWEVYGPQLVGEKQAAKFDEHFVSPLDLNDNTGEPNEIARLINDFNPLWDEPKNADERFMEAAEFAGKILKNKWNVILSNMRADDAMEPFVEKAENGIVIMDRYLPWKKAVKDKDFDFVIFPSNRGGYTIMGIKDETKEERVPFPKEWYGKREEELEQLSGIATLQFCHKSGFMAVTETLEDAVNVCTVSREKYQPGFLSRMKRKWKIAKIQREK